MRRAIDMDDAERAVRDAGESYRAFGMSPTDTVAARAAEMAYRRGFQQGAAILDYLRQGATLTDLERYDRAVYEWRMRGGKQGYRRAELPPIMLRTAVGKWAIKRLKKESQRACQS